MFKDSQVDIQIWYSLNDMWVLVDVMVSLPATESWRLWWGSNTGAWIIFQPSRFNGDDLGSREYNGNIFLYYEIDPLDLPKICDSCGAQFSISNTLGYKKVGIVATNHIYLCDGVSKLTRKSFTPLYVHEDPLIHTGHVMRVVKANWASNLQPNNPLLFSEDSKHKVDLLLWNLW